MDNSRFQERRKKLAEKLENGDIFVIFSGDSEGSRIIPVGKEHVSRNFYYLTGLMEQDLALLMTKNRGKVMETLFVPAMSQMEQFYMGENRDTGWFVEKTQIADVDYRYNLDSRISMIAFTDSLSRLFLACPNKALLSHTTQEYEFANRIRASFPHIQILDLNYEILSMRILKDEEEISCIQRAVDLTGLAVKAALQNVREGMTEGQLLALCDYTARMEGAEKVNESVVAAGNHANILHYNEETGVFRDGELGLVDLCVKYQNYTSDITRTFPVNGKFSERQAYWYNLCLKAQESIVEKMKPGADMRACGEEARAIVAEALIREGYIQEASELSLMIGQCRKDYVTVTGVNHSIGLEADETGCCSKFQTLQPGMVYTVEPGIYLGSEGMGIRIEDDYLVTEDGVRCLSAGIPKTVKEIEEAMAACR